MEDTLFNAKNFALYEFRRCENHHADMSRGAPLYYFAHLKQGCVRIVTKTGELTVHQGESFYIPMGLSYHSYWYGADPVVFYSFGLRFFPESHLHEYPLQIIPTDEALIQKMHEIPVNGTVDSVTVGLLFSLIGELLPRMRHACNRAKSASMHTALEYMRNHSIYDIPTLAKLCNMSESGFYAAFKKEVGMTPIQAKQKMQIERAELLLRTTDLPIDQVAEQAGFQTAQHFRNIFFRAYSLTPRQFRKMI